jgi:hypothetical protein
MSPVEPVSLDSDKRFGSNIKYCVAVLSGYKFSVQVYIHLISS